MSFEAGGGKPSKVSRMNAARRLVKSLGTGDLGSKMTDAEVRALKKKIEAEAKAKKKNNPILENPRNIKLDIELPSTNMSVVGVGKDRNGNSVIRVSFPNQRAFSVQVYGDMFNDAWKDLFHTRDLSHDNLIKLQSELISYIQNYGSDKQNASLRVYRN